MGLDNYLERELAQVLADVESTKERLDGLTAELREEEVTVRSRDRRVAVRVAATGQVRQVSLHGDAWRTMAREELGDLLTQTVEAARVKAVEQTRDRMAAVMPGAVVSTEPGAAADEVLASLLDTLGSQVGPTARARMEQSLRGEA